MKKWLKENINMLIGIFIILQPIIDLLTGLCLHVFNINLTIGIIIRILFLLIILYTTMFVFKKRKWLFMYLIVLFIYSCFYVGSIYLYKDGIGLFREVQGLVKVFYFPIIFLCLYELKDHIKISKMTLFTTFFLYLIMIFVPLLFGMGYQTYQITKVGTLGFFNSANEVGGIIALLTPIMFIILNSSRKTFLKILLFGMYLVVILMMGTKTPFLVLGITIIFHFIYLSYQGIKEKNWKKLITFLIVILVGVSSCVVFLPKTNFYKNIETHLDYLELDDIGDVFEDEELVDHFIFSQRLTFLHKKAFVYNHSSIYQKIVGIGYLRRRKAFKMIEMDYFDIFYSQGIIGFILFFFPIIFLILKILETHPKMTYERYMTYVSFLLVIILSFFTGHIITAPAVSLIVGIIILSLQKYKKKDILFAANTLEIGGIEKSLINLLKKLDYKKYNITLILEKKEGEFLSKVPDYVRVQELKVSTYHNKLIRKMINVVRKLWFKIMNYHVYDFSSCYATYSYSSNKISLIGSDNSSIYIHSDYHYIYPKEKEFSEFFDTRNINDFKHIIFVSNESRNHFLKYYNYLENKSIVINNFVDEKEIIKMSKEAIREKRSKGKKLLVYVGRLDDKSKKLKRALNLVNKINEIELWLVGDGEDRDMYLDYSKKLKIEDRVKFLGKRENPYPYMKLADYLILTSDYEGFPVVYLEALTLKKQVITTIDVSDDLIKSSDYFYIISKDEEKMVQDVKKYLKDSKKNSIEIDKLQKERLSTIEEIINN